MKRFVLTALVFSLLGGLGAAEAPPPGGVIDLPTALRLAGANNLDVQIAREKVAEARAAGDFAQAKFLPSITPAIVVRRHENNIQAVNGPILDINKQSLAAGLTLNAQLDLGETYYQSLVARQIVGGVYARRQLAVALNRVQISGYCNLPIVGAHGKRLACSLA